MFSRRGPRVPSGWVQAPDAVKEEIFLVWQEDEMPEEVKNIPGYVPFTLSPGAEEWLAGMAEIKELEGSQRSVIIGRPRPVTPKDRRSLIPEPLPSPAAPGGSADASPAPAPPVSTKEWVRRQAPRNVPTIAERGVAAPPPPQPVHRPERAHAVPSIGEASAGAHQEAPVGETRPVPQIGGESPSAGTPPPPEPRVKPRSVPQIGPAEDGD